MAQKKPVVKKATSAGNKKPGPKPNNNLSASMHPNTGKGSRAKQGRSY